MSTQWRMRTDGDCRDRSQVVVGRAEDAQWGYLRQIRTFRCSGTILGVLIAVDLGCHRTS